MSVDTASTTRSRPRNGRHLEHWSLAIAIVVAVLFGRLMPFEPAKVTVTVTNPTDYRLYVDASSADGRGRTFVTIVGPGATVVADEVIDRGAEWELHLETLGGHAGTVVAARSDLVGANYSIPVDVGDRLAADGVPTDPGG